MRQTKRLRKLSADREYNESRQWVVHDDEVRHRREKHRREMKMDGKRDEEDGGAKPAKSLEDELGLDNLTERVGTQQRLLGRLRQLFAEGQYRDMDLEPPPEDAWYLTFTILLFISYIIYIYYIYTYYFCWLHAFIYSLFIWCRYNTWLYREFVWKRPRWLAVLLPIVVVWVSWTTAMTALDEFHLFEDKYFMTITMLFGTWPTFTSFTSLPPLLPLFDPRTHHTASMVAGATSEGATAVAFPVMTLFFKIKPSVARGAQPAQLVYTHMTHTTHTAHTPWAALGLTCSSGLCRHVADDAERGHELRGVHNFVSKDPDRAQRPPLLVVRRRVWRGRRPPVGRAQPASLRVQTHICQVRTRACHLH